MKIQCYCGNEYLASALWLKYWARKKLSDNLECAVSCPKKSKIKNQTKPEILCTLA